jgi:hypothetical protein
VALLLSVLLGISLPVVASKFVPTGDDPSSILLAHQVGGLANPLGEFSTLPIHLNLVLDGLKSAIVTPMGLGIGSVTTAAAKYGQLNVNTEADPSNLAVAAGVPGLVVYMVLAGHGLLCAYRLAARRRDPLSLVAVGVLLTTFLQWTNGGQYAVALLPWLVLGWVDQASGHPAARDMTEMESQPC